MTQLKIKVTKEILERSKWCASDYGENCAISLAVRDIFPEAWVGSDYITPFKISNYNELKFPIPLPSVARIFIVRFDKRTPDERVQLPELEFAIDIPDEVIERINIDELRPLLTNHPTLELVK